MTYPISTPEDFKLEYFEDDEKRYKFKCVVHGFALTSTKSYKTMQGAKTASKRFLDHIRKIEFLLDTN